MAKLKVSELTEVTSAAQTDTLYLVKANQSKKITVGNLLKSANTTTIANVTVPNAANSTGNVGEIRFDNAYVYVCVQANTWKRASLVTW